jgi:hypothetical protein
LQEIELDKLSQEDIAKLIAAGVIEEIEEESDEHADESPDLFMNIEGWDEDIKLVGLKLPVLTVGTPSNGTVVIEMRVVKKMSSFFKNWMRSSDTKRVEIRVVNCDEEGKEEQVEKWRMYCLSEGMGWSEASRNDKNPWVLSIQMTAKSITVD